MMFVFLCISVILFCPGTWAQNAASEKGMIVSLFPGYYVGHIEVFKGDLATIKSSSPVRYSFGGNNTGIMITTFAPDPTGQSVHYIDVNTNGIYRIDNFTIALDHPDVSVKPVHKGLSRATCKMAYDHITNNIYWTDPLLHRVSVQHSLDPNAKPQSLFTNLLSYPVGIALDPVERILFWSNFQGDTNIIERSNLDGSDRRHIITQSLGHVEDMLVDENKKALYWIDSYKRTFETCDYEGKNRNIVRLVGNYEFSGLTQGTSVICATAFDEMFIACLDKTSGATYFTKSNAPSHPYGITIYDKDLQKQGTNFCANHKCSHICLNGKNGAVCTCQEGSTLQSDKMTCKRDHIFHPSALLVVNATHVCSVSITIINGAAGTPLCIEANTGGTSAIAVDANGNKGYYYNLTDQFIYSIDFNTEYTTSIIKVTQGVTDMAYDWINNYLYTVSKSAGTLSAFSLDKLPNVFEEVHYSGLNGVIEVELDPHNRTIYFLTKDGIFTGTFDKQPKTKIVGSPEIEEGVALFYDYLYDEIFWVDNKKGALYSAKPDGNNVQQWKFLVGVSVKHLVVYKDNAIWNDGQDYLYASLYALGGSPEKHELPMGKVTAFEIFDKSFQPKERSPCNGPDNGGCEHLCFPKADYTAFCECDFGFTLGADKKSCGTTPLEKDFLLATDLAHDRIYQISKDGNEVKTLDIPDLFVPAMARYYKGKLYWSDTGNNKIKRANLNGENIETVFSIGEGFADRFAFDYATDQLYFTVTEPNHRSKGFIAVLKLDDKERHHKTIVTGLEWPGGIALVPAKGLMFFDNHLDGDVYIGRCHMDGSELLKIITSNLGVPLGLAVDYQKERLYWTEAGVDQIEYSNFDGSDRAVLYRDPLADIIDLTLGYGMLYYVGYNRQTIIKINIDTKKREPFMLDYAEFGPMDSVDIFPTDNTQIANTACALSNGGCEYYCLSKPNNKRVCGCPDHLELVGVGGTKCQIPSTTCPLASIENGYFATGCNPTAGSKCSYACDLGFSKDPSITTLTCQTNLKWDKELSKLCLPSCGKSLSIPNGNFNSQCKGDLGEQCTFTCNKGFNRAPNAPDKLTCSNSNAQWDMKLDSLCLPPEVKCDLKAITNGNLNSKCEGKEGHFCGYTCNANYESRNSSITYLKCLSTGKWDQDTKNLCMPQRQCTSNITNGKLSTTCSRLRGILCGYLCDSGYSASTRTIRCQEDHTWDQDPTKLCSKVQVVVPPGRQTGDNTDNTGNGLVIGLTVLCVILVILIILGAVFFFFRRRLLSQDGKQQGVYRASPNVYFNAGEAPPPNAGVTGFSNPVVQMNGDTLPNTTPRTLDQVVIDANSDAVLPEKQNLENMGMNPSAGVYDTIKEKDNGVPNPLYSEMHASEELSFKMDDDKEDDKPSKPGNIYQRFH